MADEIERWRLKKLLKNLRDSRGNGTSMISIIIPPGDQISRVSKLLTDEAGTASNIKSRVNRLSVLSAITSAQQKLKQYNRTPPNGLGLYVGTVLTDDRRERKVSVGIEPVRPINTSLYLCDSRFHVEELLKQFDDESKYAFVIMDGHSTIFAHLQGNVKQILQSFNVDLPKKHGRGGQSAVRFARLRIEKRNNYIRKVAEICNDLFISNEKVNVEGLVFGGHTDFKNDLKKSDILDPRIKEKILKVVDLNYGGENGLNQAIGLSEEVLKDVKYNKEKKVLELFFNEIALDTGKFCFGMKETMECLEMACVELLVVYENLNDMVEEDVTFVDWIAENYGQFGCKLEFVSDRSGEGTQFVEGFGGVGGILRYKIEREAYEDYSEVEDDDIF